MCVLGRPSLRRLEERLVTVEDESRVSMWRAWARRGGWTTNEVSRTRSSTELLSSRGVQFAQRWQRYEIR